MPSSEQVSLWLTLALLGLVLWGAGWVLHQLSSVLLPLAIAGVLACLLDPVVDFLEQKVTSTLEQRGYKKLKEETKSQVQGRAQYLRKVYSTFDKDSPETRYSQTTCTGVESASFRVIQIPT